MIPNPQDRGSETWRSVALLAYTGYLEKGRGFVVAWTNGSRESDRVGYFNETEADPIPGWLDVDTRELIQHYDPETEGISRLMPPDSEWITKRITTTGNDSPGALYRRLLNEQPVLSA